MLHPDKLSIGDPVSASPVGAGTVTGVTDADYPQVNYVAVTWCERPDGLRFDPLNQHGGSRFAHSDSEREALQSSSSGTTYRPTPIEVSKEAIGLLSCSVNRRRVVCAAIRSKRGHILCAPRHFDTIMQQLIEFGVSNQADWIEPEDGFVDQYGNWMSRYEALTVARAAGQVLHRCPGDDRELFSENLY